MVATLCKRCTTHMVESAGHTMGIEDALRPGAMAGYRSSGMTNVQQIAICDPCVDGDAEGHLNVQLH